MAAEQTRTAAGRPVSRATLVRSWIEIQSVARGGGGYQDLVVIDGTPRYDCTEEDGWLTCSEDPQPTRE